MATAPDPRRVAAQQAKEAAESLVWTVVCDDKEWPFRLSDLTALDVAELRAQTGRFDVSSLVSDVARGHLDAQAAVLWLARRQAGEATLRWRDVAAELTLGNLVYVREDDEEAAEEDAYPDPPPSGVDSGS